MICFCWLGLPQYGARCIGAFVRATSEEVVVVASRPNVPVTGMDELVGCKVHWVGLEDDITLKVLLGEVPRVLIVPGWRFKLFNSFRDEVHSNGGRVISSVDNNYTFSLKEILKAIKFRISYRDKYDGFWVPSVSGRKLMHFYGVRNDRVFSGLYSADSSLFKDGAPLCERDKRLLFVGQFIDRKNVLRLCQAFLHATAVVKQGWILEMCGCGVLRSALPNNPSIVIHDFVQPEQLAKVYQKARAFILPSKEEHWGLVLHEAALSGCVVLASNKCGATVDFLEDGVNGFSFSPFSLSQMTSAILRAMNLTAPQLEIAQRRSVELGHRVSIQSFVNSVKLFSDNWVVD